jgi:hypothetical protein
MYSLQGFSVQGQGCEGPPLTGCTGDVCDDSACPNVQGPEFVVEFYKAVPRSLRRSLRDFDDSTRARVNRLISVWDERKVTIRIGIKHLYIHLRQLRDQRLDGAQGGLALENQTGSELSSQSLICQLRLPTASAQSQAVRKMAPQPRATG